MFRHPMDALPARAPKAARTVATRGAALAKQPDPALKGKALGAEQSTKRRGRPRAFDPDMALRRALETFWKAGYAGTSLDDLSTAMGINRPSLYAAFGDKRTLYIQAIELYRSAQRAVVEKALLEDRALDHGLRALTRAALDSYVAGGFGPRGCFMAGVAVTDAPSDPEVRRALDASICDLEAMLTDGFKRAGSAAGPPELLARMACDTLHGLALRARAGVPREELERSADAAMALLCGRREASSR